MKKLLLLSFALIIVQMTFGQLTGTKTIPGDYATIQAAVAALNAQGVGAGGVTFNVASGHTETITAVISLTATGTAANPIIFQKSGGGANPLITANTGTSTPGSAVQDGIWNLVGSDYVTINGIDLYDPNSTNPATMEYGYALFKAAVDNGCKYNTIKNCVVTLSRENNASGSGPSVEGSKAINVINATVDAQTTNVTPTVPEGTNSYNMFYSNTLQNCNYGIVLYGYAAATPFTLGDTGNDAGGSALSTGNTILNYGGATGASNPAAGIRASNQWGANISYNSINNNDGSGVNHTSTLRGIYAQSGTSADVNINNNTLTINGGGTTTQVSVIENGIGATAADNTISINNNTITNCTSATTTTGAWYGIWNNAASATNLNIQNNTFSNNATNATSGASYLIYNSGACPGTINITDNQLSRSYPGGTANTGILYSIYNTSGTTATTLNITGNNFSNYDHVTTGTGSIYFIYNSASVANNTISNNTWTNLTMNHSGSEYLMYNSTSTQVALNVNDNSIVTGYTRTGASGTFYIYYSGASSLGTSTQTFSGNNFSNINAATAGTGTFYMFYNSDGASSPYPKKALFNNTFSNITYNTTGTIYGMYTSYLGDGSTTSGTNIYNNTFSNITVSGSTYCLYIGGTVSPTYQPNVYGNNINNITTNGAASIVYGSYLAGGGAGLNFYDNKIYAVTANGATGTARGIYVTSAVTTNIFNNLVGDINAPNSSLTAPAPSVTGIYFGGGTTINAYYNSVYLNATGAGTNFGTAAVYASTTPTVTLRNNIFVDASTPNGTGKTIAYQRSSTTLTTYGAASNNNDFYAGTPGPNNLIFFDGTNAKETISDFKGFVSPNDASSVSENPSFLSTSGASANFLHINTAIATQLESGAVNVTDITDDFDGDIRQGNAGYAGTGSAPDIGADEFEGIILDLTPPNMAFTALANTSGFGNRTLTTTITDATGVPTAGIGLPVLYWKINSGSYTPATATWVSGDTYTFTFGAGVVLNDVVSYYIVAQDIVTPTPNVGANPSAGASGYTYNPPAVSTPPTSPYTYTIVGILSGVYPVGAGQVYTTLTDAIADLNVKEVIAPVTFELWDANYSASETFPLIIYPYAGMDPSRPVTFKPKAGVTATVTGAPTTGILVLYGCDYIILDGSNSGGSDRNLTWENTNTAANTYTLGVFNNSGDPASNCTIKNCMVKASSQVSSTTYAIVLNAAGGGYDNIVIDNNEIYSARQGIQFAGVSGTPTTNGQITNNLIGSMVDATAIQYRGIVLSQADNTLISGNEIMGAPAGNTNTYQAGIYIIAGSTNTTIQNNKIHDFYYTGTSGYGCYGIYYASDATTPTLIKNNLIYAIKSDGDPGSQNYDPAGIYVYAGGNIMIYHNTIFMSGATLSASYTTSYSSCISIYSGITLLDIRDNVLKNSMTTASGTGGNTAYAIYCASANTVFTNIDYNDYYPDGINAKIGYLGGAQVTLTDWMIATAQDANSQNIDPLFVSATDLMPTNMVLDNLGFYLDAVPTDFTGMNRTNPPDMGAYEFGINPAVTTMAATSVDCGGGMLNGTINANGLTVDSFFDYGPTTSYGSSMAGTPGTVTGSTTTAISAALSMPASTTWHFRARGVTSGGVTVYGNDMTITTSASGVPEATSMAATNIGNNSATLNGTVNALCNSTTVTFEYGETTAYGFTVGADQSPVDGGVVTPVSADISGLIINTLYHFRVVASSSAGTTYGADLSFMTGAAPPVVTTNPATNIGNFAARLNGTVDANNQDATVTFEWGLTAAYSYTIAGIPGTVTGNTPTAVYADISGLTYNTTYHFRCVGQNPAGTTYGEDQVFTTLCPVPLAAGTITGPTSICQATSGHVYTVPPITYAYGGYVWTVPPGGTITAGAGTNSITVSYNSSAVSGNVTVYGTSVCGNGSPSSLAVTINPLPVPTITGPDVACITSSYVYSTETGMTGYVWTVSAGGQIMSGAGTNAVTIKWNSAGAQSVSVTYTSASGCPAAAPTTLNVTVGNLPTPTITGSNMTCVNSGLHVYTTETGYSNYVWTVTSGGTIVTGQGTYQIEVNWFGAGAQTVTVNYANAYGCSAASPATFGVTVMAYPGAAGEITGTPELCAGTQGVSYSVDPIPNAVGYNWIVPAGATIVHGGNTNSILVDFALDAVTGDITVSGENICGFGTPSPAYEVRVNPIPATPVVTVDESYLLHSSAPAGNQWYYDEVLIPGAVDQDYQATEEGYYWTIVTLNDCSSDESNHVQVLFVGLDELPGTRISVYPVPNNGLFTVSIVSTVIESYTITVYNQLGVKVYKDYEMTVNGKSQKVIDLRSSSAGLYTVVIRSKDASLTRRVLITE